MPVSLDTFNNVAATSFFSSRDIVMEGNNGPELGRLGRWTVTKSQKQINQATMDAFCNALKATYGDLGVHAFESVLGSRRAFGESLRAKDIRAVNALVPQLAKKALENEVVRQIQSSPKYTSLGAAKNPQTMAKAIVDFAYGQNLVANNLYPVTNGQRDLGLFLRNAQACIQAGAEKVIDAVLAANNGNAPAIDPKAAQAEKAQLAKGLDYDVTSVEDEVRKGNIFPGMRLSNGENPTVFVELKKKGVEPGFIVKYDWSRNDTENLYMDVMSGTTRYTIAQQLLQKPGSRAAQFMSHAPWFRQGMTASELADELAAHPDAYLQIGLYTGRGAENAIPGYTKFAAIHVLKRDLTAPGHNPVKDAFIQHFPNENPQTFADNLMNPAHQTTQQDKELLYDVMDKLFQPLRDEIMRPYQPADLESGLEAFAHYGEQHIVKMDYNESDKTTTGSYRTPERTKLKQGVMYHHFRTVSTKGASVGAISEVLANDLMARTGIPSQELVLRQGGWANGKMKLLLEGTMAKDYSDLDVFLRDGRLVQNGTRLHLQEMGKFKIMLLLFGDRDGVGSRAQNKGCIGNQFFAIDPGHSLEGKKITFSTDFSFTANDDFKNYSIFDDTPRAEKFRGVVEIRKNLVKSITPQFELQDHVKANFAQYRQLANQLEEKTKTEALKKIDEMEAEFTARAKDICETFQSQLALYDAIAGDGSDPARVQDAEAAIEAEATLEKLASPTVCKSKNGEVQLRHLEVPPESRKPATIVQDPAGGFNITIAKIKQSEGGSLKDHLAQILSKDRQHLQLATHVYDHAQIDGKGETVTLHLDDAQFREFIHALNEEDVYKLKHPSESLTRP
ncbi:MAG: hypothetical protein IJS08_15590 [Victivallales bacterium]|nr:hypothetical protein [Victivallales bacterium]